MGSGGSRSLMPPGKTLHNPEVLVLTPTPARLIVGLADLALAMNHSIGRIQLKLMQTA